MMRLALYKELTRYSSLVDWFVGWLFGFYGTSTLVGYLTPNLFLYKYQLYLKKNQFIMSTQFNCQKHFYFKLFSLVKQF